MSALRGAKSLYDTLVYITSVVSSSPAKQSIYNYTASQAKPPPSEVENQMPPNLGQQLQLKIPPTKHRLCTGSPVSSGILDSKYLPPHDQIQQVELTRESQRLLLRVMSCLGKRRRCSGRRRRWSWSTRRRKPSKYPSTTLTSSNGYHNSAI